VLAQDNVDDVIGGSRFTGEIDILPVDVDGNEYWLWQAIESVSPRVVVIEMNPSLGDTLSVTVPYDPALDRLRKHPSGFYRGASLVAMAGLGTRKG